MNISEVATMIGSVVQEKNNAYGDAFVKVAEALKILYPNGIKPEEYQDVAVMIRIFDKMMRISNGHKDDSWKDIAGYGVLMEWLHQSLSKIRKEMNEGPNQPCVKCDQPAFLLKPGVIKVAGGYAHEICPDKSVKVLGQCEYCRKDYKTEDEITVDFGKVYHMGCYVEYSGGQRTARKESPDRH